jgi:hypothetical protein
VLHPTPVPARIAVLGLLLLFPACAEEAAKVAGGADRFYTAEDLDEIVLSPDEAPEGTEVRADASGPYDLEDFWPSSCCLGLQEQFDQAGFQTAQVTMFEQPGHSADPLDTRPGWEQVSSTAVLFFSEEGASQAMDTWIDYYRAPVLEPVDVDGLGVEAVGLAGSPMAPAEQLVLYFWRRGRLVLSLRASTGTGTVPLAQVRRLADRMDARAS